MLHEKIKAAQPRVAAAGPPTAVAAPPPTVAIMGMPNIAAMDPPPSQPKAPVAAGAPVKSKLMQHKPDFQEIMTNYVVEGLNLSMKGCLEGEVEVCSLLKKGCETVKMAGVSTPAEAMLCQSIESVCPQNMQGLDIRASLCLQHTTPICKAASQLCSAVAGSDPQKEAMCLQTFQSMCKK